MSACASGTVSKEKANLHFEIGRSFFDDDRYPDAIGQFQESLRQDPERPEILLYLGMAHYKMENYQEAEKHVRRACELAPTYAECWNNLAVVELGRGQPKAAIVAARKALSFDTYSTPEIALGNWARAQVALKDYSGALANLDKALRLKNDSCALKQIRVQVLIRKNNFEDALESAQALRRACPLEANSHLWEAYALYKIGQRKEALAKYLSIRDLFPEGPLVEDSRRAAEAVSNKIPPKEPRT